MLCVQLADVFVCVRNVGEKVIIIIVIVVVIVVVVVSSHSLSLPGISTFVPKVIPTALSSSFTCGISSTAAVFCLFLRHFNLVG